MYMASKRARSERSALLRAVRKYAALGFSVLPVAARSKFPDAKALRHSGTLNWLGQPSWLALTRSPAGENELRCWFSAGRRNLGIVTGFGDLIALDFDAPGSYESWRAKHRRIVEHTCVQRTRNGFHVLFRWKGAHRTQISISHDFVLIRDPQVRVGQIKGASDYIVVWPSIHPSGSEYRWLRGRAPWEMRILRIRDLREIGIEQYRKPWWKYVAMIPRMFSSSGKRPPMIIRWFKNRFAKLTGMYFQYR